MSTQGKTTTDHETIRQWVEQRGGKPARVKGTGSASPDEDPGMLRIDMPGYSGGESLEPISWDQFFKAFEQNRLALVYQETTDEGEHSNFNKLVSRDRAAA